MPLMSLKTWAAALIGLGHHSRRETRRLQTVRYPAIPFGEAETRDFGTHSPTVDDPEASVTVQQRVLVDHTVLHDYLEALLGPRHQRDVRNRIAIHQQ